MDLVVKVTVGVAEAERLEMALMVAATAAASGTPVTLWLAGEATWLATGSSAAGPEAIDLFTAVVESGRVLVCARCAARRDLTAADFVPGTAIAGAAAFVEQVLSPETRALVY